MKCIMGVFLKQPRGSMVCNPYENVWIFMKCTCKIHHSVIHSLTSSTQHFSRNQAWCLFVGNLSWQGGSCKISCSRNKSRMGDQQLLSHSEESEGTFWVSAVDLSWEDRNKVKNQKTPDKSSMSSNQYKTVAQLVTRLPRENLDCCCSAKNLPIPKCCNLVVHHLNHVLIASYILQSLLFG